MLLCAAIFIVAILLAFYEIPPMLEKYLLKECVVFSVLLLIGTSLMMAFVLDVNLPNPSEGLLIIIKPLMNLIDYLLG